MDLNGEFRMVAVDVDGMWQRYTYAMLLSGIADPVVCAVVVLQTGVLAIG